MQREAESRLAGQALLVSGRFQALFLNTSCCLGFPGRRLDGPTVFDGEETREAKR